ncbi:MAG TPA: 7TM domain-containing protein [Patescibacteria group bacterium]|nr:7TM domain-containing protein [Patescibacteria group bacterium]
MKRLYIALILLSLFFLTTKQIFAQITIAPQEIDKLATAPAEISTPAAETKPIKQEDLTKPEEAKARQEFIRLFNKRPINEPQFLNIMGYTVQYAVRSGVPVNTIILILLLPFLATMIVFFRQIVGIPTLEVLVPIAFSITLVATGLGVGLILLTTVLIASIIARIIVKRIKIMQLPKMALSMFIVSGFVFVSLTVCASLRLFDLTQLSFLPVLLFILLSDRIVAVQLLRGVKPAIIITLFTLILGLLGYFILSNEIIRNFVLLYPEITLILIPVNILIGRYFGLRFTEYSRFRAFKKYVDQ